MVKAPAPLPPDVPSREIPRRRWPQDLPSGAFERDFAASNSPCIVEGLVDDWPAHVDPQRCWRRGRWESFAERGGDSMVLSAGFDPQDNRMMHFGDEDPCVLYNPGRLQMPAWTFLEVGRLRRDILREKARLGPGAQLDLERLPEIRARLDREVEIQNLPFLSVDVGAPYLQHFVTQRVKLRDLVPLSFYLSHDTGSLPRDMQEDVLPHGHKLVPGWGSAHATRLWVTDGAPWTQPYPPWSCRQAPEPAEDEWIYSCFHCDRMENLHSLLAGEKRVVLVSPEHGGRLKATRHSRQRQWLMVPVGSSGGQTYLGSTFFESELQKECTSAQSAVNPLGDSRANRAATDGAWPDEVDFPVWVGTLRPGDTLYIPAYWWHWVATATPPALGEFDEGSLAMSVNFWWWPRHRDEDMERWCYQVESDSFENARIPVSDDVRPPPRRQHMETFRLEALRMRQEASVPRPWPRMPEVDEGDYEIVD